MDRKKKLMAAAVAGAVLVLVACSAARCAVSGAAGEAGGAAAEEQREGGAEMEGTAEERALSALRSRAWRSEADAGSTVAFRDGSFVEADASGVKVAAFEALSASESDDRCELVARVVRDGGGEDCVMVIEGREGSLRVSCDAFANAPSYVEAPPGGEAAVTGLADGYLALVGGDAGAVEAAVSSYCRANVPAARSASFDGEVYLDTAAGRVTATFHCDDPASTILTVTYAGGEFAVAG